MIENYKIKVSLNKTKQLKFDGFGKICKSFFHIHFMAARIHFLFS